MKQKDTIPHRLLRLAAERPSTVAYHHKSAGRWQPTTFGTYAEQVRTAARALLALGFAPASESAADEPRSSASEKRPNERAETERRGVGQERPPGRSSRGHRGVVTILGFNRPEWVIMDVAAMMAGGAAAGIYTTCSPDEVQYIVHHSESLVVLVEDAAQLAKVQARRDELPQLKWIVMMRGAQGTGRDVLTWEDFLAKAEGVPDKTLDERLEAILPGDLATLIYTSGTTGPPKGVMLSHDNLAWTSQTMLDVGGARDGDVSLSYLPLSHIAEQMATIHMPLTAGSTVYFAESLEKIPDNLKDARPTVFFGVPRIWEKFHAAMTGKLAEVTGVKKTLVAWARKTCTAVNAHRDRGEPIPRVLDVQYRLAQRLVIGKIKAALGFDRAATLISGAAPIAPDVLAFFASLDMPIREIYGQSEDTGPTSFNLPGRTRIGTVGPPLPGLQVKIAEDGEILVKGRNVFLGYYKEPEATAESLRDGWLCSGDLGAFDREGFLSITGRKKEIIITAGGKNIAPKNIEAALKESPLVGEAVVIGDRRKYLTALITIEPAAGDKAGGAEALRHAVQSQIDAVNQTLARVEQIKKFAILPRPFGIDTGELTPTMKLKRKVIAQKYATEIEAMYADGGE